ncbi:MAG TPA: VanZ family protein [Gemmatimonadales bacterium]|jgi:hypothetical protein
MNRRETAWRVVAMAWLAVIGWLTLRPAPDQAARVAALHWYCISCGDSGSADIVLNILLFIPLGLAARALRIRCSRLLAVVVPLTVMIEVTQGLFLVGRDASLGDVLTNTTGAALAWWLYPAMSRLGGQSATEGRRHAAAVLGCIAAVFLISGVAFSPVPADDGPWVGQILYRWAGHDPFPGTIQRASVNGTTIPNDPLDSMPRVTDRINLTIEAARTSDTLPARSASLVRVVDADHRTRVSVSEISSALVLEVALRGARWGFHAPSWRFDRMMDIPLGTPVQFDFAWSRAGVRLNRIGLPAGVTRAETITPTLDVGWAFVHPFVDTIDPRAIWWSILWIGWWWGWLGWTSGAAGWRFTAAAGFASAVIVALAAAITGVAAGGVELFAAPAALIIGATAVSRLRSKRATNS